MKRIAKILYAPDGEELFRKIQEHLAGFEQIQIEDQQTQLAADEETWLVVVVILTAQAMHDPLVNQLLQESVHRRLLILPVLEDREHYNFAALPEVLQSVAKRNAVGWKSSDPDVPDGQQILETIKGWLGLTLFEEDRTLFISYCRADGSEIALAAYDYFTNRGYRAFLDTEKIAGGAVFQRFIRKSIFDRDLLLLLDTPKAKDSMWIQEEIQTAIENRIKIVVLRVPGGKMPLPQGLMVLEYTNTDMFPVVEKVLTETVAATVRFDMKVEDTLDVLASEYGFRVNQEGSRKALLTKRSAEQGPSNVLLEYESAPHSLEAVYRLHCDYQDYTDRGMPIASACFVYPGIRLSPYQKNAIYWARKDTPLDVMTLDEFVYAMLNQPEGRETQ